MKEVLFTVLTDADKRSKTAVRTASVNKLSAGLPWYDAPSAV